MRKKPSLSFSLDDIPEEKKIETLKDKILTLINQSNGLTVIEMSQILKCNPRTVREYVSLLRYKEMVSMKLCQCGHSPVYFRNIGESKNG